jgi:plastocyanin
VFSDVLYTYNIKIMKTLAGSKNKLFTVLALLFVVLMISFSCSKSSSMYGGGGGGGGNGGPGANEVWIQGMAFVPSTITVSAGTTITWTNKDGMTHTVTSDAALFDSGNIGSGGTYSHNFATAGTYKYHCSIHPTTMLGKVIVN